jgi:molecular chaperone DnaK (HSP70)
VDNIQPDVDLSLTLTRANFEEINAPLFKRCMDTVASVLKDALVPIERVRLLEKDEGGGSRLTAYISSAK